MTETSNVEINYVLTHAKGVTSVARTRNTMCVHFQKI